MGELTYKCTVNVILIIISITKASRTAKLDPANEESTDREPGEPGAQATSVRCAPPFVVVRIS